MINKTQQPVANCPDTCDQTHSCTEPCPSADCPQPVDTADPQVTEVTVAPQPINDDTVQQQSQIPTGLLASNTAVLDNKTLQNNKLGHPIQIKNRRMIGKKLHFLTLYEHSSKPIWVTSDLLKPEMVAEYLAASYAKRKKQQQRKRSLIGQS